MRILALLWNRLALSKVYKFIFLLIFTFWVNSVTLMVVSSFKIVYLVDLWNLFTSLWCVLAWLVKYVVLKIREILSMSCLWILVFLVLLGNVCILESYALWTLDRVLWSHSSKSFWRMRLWFIDSIIVLRVVDFSLVHP